MRLQNNLTSSGGGSGSGEEIHLPGDRLASYRDPNDGRRDNLVPLADNDSVVLTQEMLDKSDGAFDYLPLISDYQSLNDVQESFGDYVNFTFINQNNENVKAYTQFIGPGDTQILIDIDGIPTQTIAGTLDAPFILIAGQFSNGRQFVLWQDSLVEEVKYSYTDDNWATFTTDNVMGTYLYSIFGYATTADIVFDDDILSISLEKANQNHLYYSDSAGVGFTRFIAQSAGFSDFTFKMAKSGKAVTGGSAGGPLYEIYDYDAGIKYTFGSNLPPFVPAIRFGTAAMYDIENKTIYYKNDFEEAGYWTLLKGDWVNNTASNILDVDGSNVKISDVDDFVNVAYEHNSGIITFAGSVKAIVIGNLNVNTVTYSYSFDLAQFNAAIPVVTYGYTASNVVNSVAVGGQNDFGVCVWFDLNTTLQDVKILDTESYANYLYLEE